MARWKCEDCQTLAITPRPFLLHFGPNCRCPVCGTVRVSRLAKRDKIDRMLGGPLNLAERLAGGRLYHCRFCRVQFYDRRPHVEAPLVPIAESMAQWPEPAVRGELVKDDGETAASVTDAGAGVAEAGIADGTAANVEASVAEPATAASEPPLDPVDEHTALAAVPPAPVNAPATGLAPETEPPAADPAPSPVAANE
jgi:hypothetical protein